MLCEQKQLLFGEAQAVNCWEAGAAGTSDIAPTGCFARAANHHIVAVPSCLQGGGSHVLGYHFTNVSSYTYTRYCVWLRHYFLCLHFHRSFMIVLCS